MNFEMTGKLTIGKETEKFKPYADTTYESGWVRRQLMFNAVCGDSRHMLTITGGSWADGHGEIYTFGKNTVDENGKKVKGEQLSIPFKDRLTSPKLAEVSDFRKMVVDLEVRGRRYKLENAVDKVKEGTDLTTDELKELGLNNQDEVKDALEKSNKKHHEFISEWDFAEFMKKVLDSDKYKDKNFYIRGSVNYELNEDTGRIYESYVPSRIYLADDDAEPHSTATLNFLYDANSLDEMSVEEKGRYYVNGYTMEYNRNRKANIPVPITITIPVAPDGASDKEKGKVEIMKKRFVVTDDSVKEYGIVVNMINGAQKMEITEDMLTDEQKEDLEWGLITMDDIRADLGDSVYGDRIREYQFVKPGKGFTKGRQDTCYTADDLVIKPLEVDEETENLFDDDDDEL